CAKLWDQCGGSGYHGSICCVQGAVCHEISESYHQCIEPSSS
ncbi:unnamed protein product, partial [Sphacelaria rigidula]